MIFILFIVSLFLHLVTGVEITSIQTYHHELNVIAGQQLLIPCHFQLDEPLGDNRIKLQWSVKPPDEDEFQPIYQTEDTTRLTLKFYNNRASMRLSDVHQGDCSLVIDPVHHDDAGTYDLRIAINGEEFPGDTRVDVHIRESRVQIKSIQTYHELNVTVGQQLLIPCHFQLDEPLEGDRIKLAWSVKPPGKDEFQPIYQFEDTPQLTVKAINSRARMHWADVRQGDCSLAIDPVHRDDAGTYDLRIAINGEVFPGDTRVDVHIRGSRIKSIQTYHHELNVKAGQQLVIPCRFQLDEHLRGNKIKLQWSVKPPDEDEFQPIYQFEDTTQPTVKDINSRARMHLSDVHQGDCSLVIDPVHRDDAGTYDLRIAINGEEFPGDTRVDVHIRESRVKIKSIQTYQHELNTTVGHQLIIPCHFNVDKPLSNNLVLLKWSMRPIGEYRFQPIIKVYDTKLQPVEHPTRTVSVDVPQVRQGICSLRINPVHLNDSGTYEVQLAINGEEFPGHTRVNIYVKESDKETDPNQPMNEEESQSRKASENEDLNFMRTAEVLQGLKNNYSLIVLGICGGVLLLIVLLSMVLIIYFGCRYCQLKHKAVDDVKQMEEGRQCGLPVPTTYVSIPENWHKESNSTESWHEGSNSAESWHEESNSAESWHEESNSAESWHEESNSAESWHEESNSAESWHKESNSAESWHEESNPIPTSSQVKVADPPPLMTAEERQRVLKRVRSKVRDYVKLKKYLK